MTKKGRPYPIDLNTLLSHHLLILGATGSGKSTSLLQVVEQLVDVEQTSIIFDATGEYRHLHNAVHYQLGMNANISLTTLDSLEIAKILALQPEILQKKLTSAIQALQIQQNVVRKPGTYTKINRQMAVFNQDVQKLSVSGKAYQPMLLADQMIEEFVIPYDDGTANYQLLGQQYHQIAIQRHWDALSDAKLQLSTPRLQAIYDLAPERRVGSRDLMTQTDLIYVLKLFSCTPSKQRPLVIDISALSDDHRQSQLVMDILLKALLQMRQNTAQRFPITVFLDEYHRYVPQSQQDLTGTGVFKLLREGRKYGISIVLATQSPTDLPVALRGQFGSYLIHRLQDHAEIQTVLHKKFMQQVPELTAGEAILKPFGQKQVKQIRIVLPQTQHETASPQY